MRSLGDCHPCKSVRILTPAALILDGTPVCRTHVRGDGADVRAAYRLKLSTEASLMIVPRPEPRIMRAPPQMPMHLTKDELAALIAPEPKALPTPAQVRPVLLMESEETVSVLPESRLPIGRWICEETARAFDLAPYDLKTRCNRETFVLPRCVAMYLLRKHTLLSTPQIGRMFAGKHHTTVMHSIAKIARRLETDRKLADKVQQIWQQVRTRRDHNHCTTLTDTRWFAQQQMRQQHLRGAMRDVATLLQTAGAA